MASTLRSIDQNFEQDYRSVECLSLYLMKKNNNSTQHVNLQDMIDVFASQKSVIAEESDDYSEV